MGAAATGSNANENCAREIGVSTRGSKADNSFGCTAIFSGSQRPFLCRNRFALLLLCLSAWVMEAGEEKAVGKACWADIVAIAGPQPDQCQSDQTTQGLDSPGTMGWGELICTQLRSSTRAKV